MTPPAAFFQVRKIFKQFRRTSPFDAPQYSPRCPVWWHRHQNMYMVLTNNALQYLYFKCFICLPDQFPYFQPYVAFQYHITIFRHKYKMILHLKNRMATVTIFHNAPLLQHQGKSNNLKDKSNRFKGGGFNLSSN